jgi:HAD superfamily hydrolase (TIGR01549 family)
MMLTDRSTASVRRVVIFDMDGTLTRPHLDFDRMREEIGLEPGPLLEAVLAMAPEDRAAAEVILQRHEDEAAAASELHAGAAEVVSAVREAGLSPVLMTRNSRRSVDMVLRRHRLSFDMIRTREDGAMKPSPEPIFDICRRLDADPRQSWTVGDFHYDIRCGAAAGCTTVLLLTDKGARPDWASQADHVIHDLRELLGIVRAKPE